jgi:hypothetical protein
MKKIYSLLALLSLLLLTGCSVYNFTGTGKIDAKTLNSLLEVKNQEALANMKGANVNLIFLEKMSDYKGHIPGKIFEYVAVKQPVIGVCDPAGDTASIISQSGCGKVYAAESNWLSILNSSYDNWKNHHKPQVNDNYIKQFHRRQLTHKLVDFFGEVL